MVSYADAASYSDEFNELLKDLLALERDATARECAVADVARRDGGI